MSYTAEGTSSADLPQTLEVLTPGLLSNPQIHVPGLPSDFDQMRIGKFPEVMGQGCPGDWDLCPQINARDLIFGTSDPFEDFKPSAVDESSRYAK
jgi:hypothetical protein